MPSCHTIAVNTLTTLPVDCAALSACSINTPDAAVCYKPPGLNAPQAFRSPCEAQAAGVNMSAPGVTNPCLLPMPCIVPTAVAPVVSYDQGIGHLRFAEGEALGAYSVGKISPLGCNSADFLVLKVTAGLQHLLNDMISDHDSPWLAV